jgi:N-acetylglutamate synthase-like GNAT family acetyltransferase
MENFSFTTKIPEKQSFYGLFNTTSWNAKYKLNSDQLYSAIENSWYLISAYDSNNLIGFGRIICDGIVHALILDLIVHPQYQGKGIGVEILNRLVKKCKEHHIKDIQLFCAKGYITFYEKHGFVKRPDDAPGMEYTEELHGN